MFFSSNKLEKSTRLKCHSPLASKHQFNVNQCFSCGDNGVFSMDATFGINDMKFYLFTSMGFGAHCTSVPLTWVITSQQTIKICSNG
jgi:hypothetical protein